MWQIQDSNQGPQLPRALQTPHLSVSRRSAWNWMSENVCHPGMPTDAAWQDLPPGSLSITLALTPCPLGPLLPFVACQGSSPCCPGRAKGGVSDINCNPNSPSPHSLALQFHTQTTLFISLGISFLICRVTIIILASQDCGEDEICESVL